jgi:hypothetical protein
VLSSVNVLAEAPVGYQAGFFVCGLPADVTASFFPNPALARSNANGVGISGAFSVMTVSTPAGVFAGTYPLVVHADFEDSGGVPQPSAGAIFPVTVLLKVDASGQTTLAPSDVPTGVGFSGCSAPPAGFGAVPTATAGTTFVAVSAFVSDPHPQLNEAETVYGQVLVNGQPQSGVPFHAIWFLPEGQRTCDGITTSSGTGGCAVTIIQSTPGFGVVIQLTFQFNGQQYLTYASFTE